MLTPTAPPRFQAYDPERATLVYRRDLPHWRQEGATYFVTFQTKDSLPKEAVADIQRTRERWLSRNPPPHSEDQSRLLNRLIAIRTEHWLHHGLGACPFRHLEHRQRLYDALLHFHGTEEDQEEGDQNAKSVRIELGAFVVMPNHVHVLGRPLPDVRLEDWAGSVKQFVGRRTPAEFKTASGKLWQKEAHDRIVRNLDHLNNCLRYIGRNPEMAGIPPEASNTLWINPEWVALGWSLGSCAKFVC